MLKKMLVFFIIINLQFVFAQNIRISQIDNSDLLLNQKIKLYLSVTDSNGKPIQSCTKEMFNIYESVDGSNFKMTEGIIDFIPKGNENEGINFLLLIDNSGSMYDDMNGMPTKDPDKMRITHVKKAIKQFLSSINKPQDKVGIASYNSYYTLYSKPVSDKALIKDYLEAIQKPTGDEAWTEIYSSLYLAIDEFNQIDGRKVIVILTDGENMPYYTNTKKEHRIFKDKVFDYKEPITKAEQEGLSIFAINFGRQGERKDKNLNQIASRTGGVVFDAYSEDELNRVYFVINDLILNEYIMTYRATMDPGDKKIVKVEYNYKNKDFSGSRYYFSSMIFGMPLKDFNPLILLVFLLALLALFLLSLIKFKNLNKNATLEVIATQVGRVGTQVVTLSDNKTIIGSSKDANMTIAGNSFVKSNHATIQFDKTEKQYTIVADGDLTVNNKPVKKRNLEDGDVINVGGTTIVFDGGDITKLKKKK
jgi:Ca-activated chloride channel family protein